MPHPDNLMRGLGVPLKHQLREFGPLIATQEPVAKEIRVGDLEKFKNALDSTDVKSQVGTMNLLGIPVMLNDFVRPNKAYIVMSDGTYKVLTFLEDDTNESQTDETGGGVIPSGGEDSD